MSPKGQKKQLGPKPVASNRKARHDYEVLDTVECGMALLGSEVKSIRDGKVQMRESFARVEDGEVWLYGMHVSPWVFAAGFGAHDPERRRKLLLHRREIDSLRSRLDAGGGGLTLVPLSVYFKEGRAKLELALARGRKTYDKRHAIAERDAGRDLARELRTRQKGSSD